MLARTAYCARSPGPFWQQRPYAAHRPPWLTPRPDGSVVTTIPDNPMNMGGMMGPDNPMNMGGIPMSPDDPSCIAQPGNGICAGGPYGLPNSSDGFGGIPMSPNDPSCIAQPGNGVCAGGPYGLPGNSP